MKIDRVKAGSLKTNVWLIEGEAAEEGVHGEVIIIDPGDEPEKILEAVGSRRVAAVLLTHGHYDHMQYADEIADETGSFVYCSDKECEMMQELCDDIRARYGGHLEPPKVDFRLNDGDVLQLAGLEVKVMLTPGHTWGSCGYVVTEPGGDPAVEPGVDPAVEPGGEPGAEQLHFFSGDTLFARDYGRTDMLGGDPEAMEASLERIATELPPETLVYPGHGPATSIAREAAANSWWPVI